MLRIPSPVALEVALERVYSQHHVRDFMDSNRIDQDWYALKDLLSSQCKPLYNWPYILQVV